MRRTLGMSGFVRSLNTLTLGMAGAIVLLSCSESTTAPRAESKAILPDGSFAYVYHYPDSVRYGPQTGWVTVSPNQIIDNALTPDKPAFVSAAPTATYTVTSVPFAPEASVPTTAGIGPTNDFSVKPNVPIGFTFNFFGNAYTTVNISSSGLIQFGNPQTKDGCCWGWFIARNDDINNVIALGWSAWTASAVSRPIRYETRGTAPNRRFVIQYFNLPEDGGGGHLNAQLILYEGTNDIVLYTTQLNTTIRRHSITQGLENNAGSEASFAAGRDSALFSIANDGVKFALSHVNTAPAITQPADVALNTDASVCVANATVPAPAFTDDAPGATISGVRSDGLALNAAYPKGSTTITWTATDVEGLKSSVTQTVVVSDKEKPTVTAPQNISTRVNRGVSFATVNAGQATAADNCQSVQVTGARSDNAPLNAGYPIGVTTITWTATDGSQNTATASQTVTVVGNQPPVVTPPANIAVNTDAGVCSAVVDPGVATVHDDTDGATVVGSRADGQPLNSPYPKGVTTIHWTGTDADGLQTVADQTVTVSDKEKPSVTAPANISVGNDRTHNYAVVAVGAPSAADNCPGVTVSGARNDGQALGNTYPVGVTTITWSARDASGNTASANQTVTVVDTEKPHVMLPNDWSVNATSPNGALVTYNVTATDNVGVVSVVCQPLSGTVFKIGYTDITCVASDAAGNTASAWTGVEVLGAHDQLVNLIEYVESLGLSNGVENPLVNQLRAADRDGSDPSACTKLNDFVHMVSVKNGSLSSTQSAYMITEARRIQAVLGCSGVPASTSMRLAPVNGVRFNRSTSR